jgi:hypothetical protein
MFQQPPHRKAEQTRTVCEDGFLEAGVSDGSLVLLAEPAGRALGEVFLDRVRDYFYNQTFTSFSIIRGRWDYVRKSD